MGLTRAILQIQRVFWHAFLGEAVPVAFVEAGLVDVTMHEVGHTLGLRHNFKASSAYSFAQLSDPSFTESHGFAASVMDYVGAFLPSNRSLAVVGSDQVRIS